MDAAAEPSPSPVRAILAAWRLAIRRLAWSKFMWANVLLSAIPVAICLLIAIFGRGDRPVSIDEMHDGYEGFLRILYLHFIVFFLANIFGFAVVRQETEDHTLHYLLLAPAPRWTLFAGRFLAYLTLVWICCVGSLWLGYGILMARVHDAHAVMADLFAHGRLWILVRESGVLALGLMVYGAIAMLAGSFFKSGLYAIVLLGWEWFLPYMPLVLKKWTVLFYLQSLLPDPPPQGMTQMFELLSDPAGRLHCFLALGLTTAIALGAAMVVFQWRECQYGES